jgi:hypothetical protein
MPSSRYAVQHTSILHGSEGEKTATRYGIGEVVELTEQEAAALGDNVKAAESPVTDIETMTVEQLKAAIAEFRPIEELKGLKKAELVTILKAHRETESA